MDSKFLPGFPKDSIINSRISLFNIEEIAKASTVEELRAATGVVLDNLTRIDEISKLKKVQSIAKKLQMNPNDSKLLGEMNEAFIDAENKYSVKTGRYAWGSLTYQDEKYYLSARQDLIEEYQAKTPSELLVIDTALVAYFRYIRATKLFNSLIEDGLGYKDGDQVWINTVKELNKTINSASQQMMMAFTFLKELKRQPIQVKVQTQNAYFAQNQQINEDRL